LLAGDVALDVVAVELGEALSQLGELTGEVKSDDILDRIFSGFCVGK
jgi:tRNA modification GTPase